MYNVLFNIFLGLSLGLIISHFFKEQQRYHGPNSIIFTKKIFKENGKCYKLKPKLVDCSIFSSHD